MNAEKTVPSEVPQFSIRGHSGYDVQILHDPAGRYIVRKSSTEAGHSARLKRQAKKQRDYRPPLPFVRVPAIVAEHESGPYYAFDMEYCCSNDFVSFLLAASKAQIDIFIGRILEIIDDGISQSASTEVVVSETLAPKYEVVRANIAGAPFDGGIGPMLAEVDRIMGALPPTIRMPIGPCHGDLTFSNVLIDRASHRLVLIDFLDTFLESPLQDIVKLRQDTRHRWSLLLYEHAFDRTKMHLALAYLDRIIHGHYLGHEFYRDHYGLFQLLNLLRILQYARHERIIKHLCREIDMVLKESF